MWFYEQQVRRFDDPAVAFRAISAQKAADRRARLSAMRWYGFSNARPQASIDIVHGPYSPGDGLRCNPNKLLLDPYAKAVDGSVQWDQAVYGYRFGEPDSRDDSGTGSCARRSCSSRR